MDILATLAVTEIKPYPNQCGSVRLVDCLPRIVPEGRGCDYVIAQRARVSTGQGLKAPDVDARLIERLYKDHHTSPFEGVSFVYELEVPGFVAQQLLRHRTAKVNVFSQRYAEVPETMDWFTPPIRVPHPTLPFVQANYGVAAWAAPVAAWDWKTSPPNVRPHGQWPHDAWPEVVQCAACRHPVDLARFPLRADL
jgi:hypothetical protein